MKKVYEVYDPSSFDAVYFTVDYARKGIKKLIMDASRKLEDAPKSNSFEPHLDFWMRATAFKILWHCLREGYMPTTAAEEKLISQHGYGIFTEDHGVRVSDIICTPVCSPDIFNVVELGAKQ